MKEPKRECVLPSPASAVTGTLRAHFGACRMPLTFIPCFTNSDYQVDFGLSAHREEDLLTWQSGQINERFEASTIDDNRLKQQRGPDWAASCASSGSKALDSLQVSF